MQESDAGNIYYSRRSIESQVAAYRAKAKTALPEMMRRADKWASKFGGTVVKNENNIKTAESIKRKLKADKFRSPRELKDVVRTTVIVGADKFEAAVAFATAEASRYSYARAKRQDTDAGYTGFISNFRARNGVTYEIQINTPEMIYAKEDRNIAAKILGKEKYMAVFRKVRGTRAGQGHRLYEQSRVLDDTKSRRAKNEINAKSKQYYSMFRHQK